MKKEALQVIDQYLNLKRIESDTVKELEKLKPVFYIAVKTFKADSIAIRTQTGVDALIYKRETKKYAYPVKIQKMIDALDKAKKAFEETATPSETVVSWAVKFS